MADLYRPRRHPAQAKRAAFTVAAAVSVGSVLSSFRNRAAFDRPRATFRAQRRVAPLSFAAYTVSRVSRFPVTLGHEPQRVQPLSRRRVAVGTIIPSTVSVPVLAARPQIDIWHKVVRVHPRRVPMIVSVFVPSTDVGTVLKRQGWPLYISFRSPRPFWYGIKRHWAGTLAAVVIPPAPVWSKETGVTGNWSPESMVSNTWSPESGVSNTWTPESEL